MQKALSRNPLIRISSKAFKKMNYYVRLSPFPNEIGWLGTVQKNGNCYFIGDVFLFEQKVRPGFFKFLPGSIAKFATDLIKQGDKDIVNSLFFWGHLHLGNTFPSLRDEQQMAAFSDNDFMIRGIADRRGRLEFSIFDYKTGRVFYGVPWEIWDPGDEELKAEIKKEIKEKIHPVRRRR